MVFDCSFAEYGSYGEMGNAWESLQINSISVIPEEVTDVENVYCADTANMSDVSFSVTYGDACFVQCLAMELHVHT